VKDWLWRRCLLPWQIAVRLRIYRFRRCTVRETWDDGRESVSYYWTPLGVLTHERRMRRSAWEVETLLLDAELDQITRDAA
jgi:hypothetical protein